MLPHIKRMRTRLENLYLKLGIDVVSNKVLRDYLSLTEIKNEILRKQFELFHMDFIVGLNAIKEFDKKSFNRYIKSINDTKENVNFWGEKFEVFLHSKLIKATPQIITNLKRGIDGFEPDLLFDFKDSNLGIELTTLKYTVPPKNETQVLSKITERILEKSSKKYPNPKCALLIDITNIVAYEKLYNFSLNEIFNSEFNGFSYLQKEIDFGMIILCNSIFKKNSDNTLFQTLNPKLGLFKETENMDKDLNQFINILFNNFKPNDDYDLGFYHLNM